jgi:hypothetical protein
MQKRRVGRLVVSWNWGRGLGIVTQTSLLRVFDPMEMYGVIENLQQTIQQLESERSPSLPSPPADLLPQRTGPRSQQDIAGDRELLLALLDNAYKDVKYMLANLDIVVEQRRSLLQSVLETLAYLGREISS